MWTRGVACRGPATTSATGPIAGAAYSPLPGSCVGLAALASRLSLGTGLPSAHPSWSGAGSGRQGLGWSPAVSDSRERWKTNPAVPQGREVGWPGRGLGLPLGSLSFDPSAGPTAGPFLTGRAVVWAPGREQDDRPLPDTGRCPGQGSLARCSSALRERPGLTGLSRAPGARVEAGGWRPSQPPADCSVIHPPQPLQNNFISLGELLAACQGGAPEEGPPTPQGGALIRQEHPSTHTSRNVPFPHPRDLPFHGAAGPSYLTPWDR